MKSHRIVLPTEPNVHPPSASDLRALTWVFGGAVLASLVAVLHHRKEAFWGTWAYHLLVVTAGLVVLAYLAAHGIIGHRFWT